MHNRTTQGSYSSGNSSINTAFDPVRLAVESPTDSSTIGGDTDSDMVIAVMGPTGAGKSTLINKIVGATRTTASDSLQSCTREMQSVEYLDSQGRRIILVDTPGFNDTNLSDLVVLELIGNWLKQTYQEGKMLSGLLFLHRISDNRMGQSPLRLLETFKNICGEDAFQNIVLVTTMWDEVAPEDGEAREQQLRDKYWKHMLTLGSRMERFRYTQESARHVISKFGRETSRPLLMQREMVDELKPLSETTAGRPLVDWLLGIVSFVKKVTKALQGKLRRAKKVQRQALEEDIRQQQHFLEDVEMQIERYRTSSVSAMGKITEILPPPSIQRSIMHFRPAPSARLNLPPQVSPATGKITEILPPPSIQRSIMHSRPAPSARLNLHPLVSKSESPSLASTTLSTPTDSCADSCLSEHTNLSVRRSKYIKALKLIHDFIRDLPVPGLSSLVEMVFTIGEMIEAENPEDVVLLSQFEDICTLACSFVEAARSKADDFVETIICSFMTDMVEIRRIIERTSSKTLSGELLSDRSKTAIEKCKHRLSVEGNWPGVKRFRPRKNIFATEETLNTLIKELRTPSPPSLRPF